MKDDAAYQDELKAEVLRHFGDELETSAGFEKLSVAIEKETGSRLSEYTLKRFFGRIKNSSSPSITTQSILARYVGYAGWNDFIMHIDEQDFTQKNLVSKKVISKNKIVLLLIFLGAILLGGCLWFLTRQPERLPSQEQMSGIMVYDEDTLMWQIDRKSWALSIDGRGKMKDFLENDITECWLAYRDSLRSVVINEGVNSIGNNAFYGCSRIEAVKLPESLVSIGSGAFKECQKLRDIVVPNNVKTVRFDAFAHCYSLRSCVFLGDVSVLDRYVFARCSSLKSVTLPSSLLMIGEYCFLYCRSLEEITIPEGVTLIREYAFKGCEALKHVTLPASLKNVDSSVFENCNNLKLNI